MSIMVRNKFKIGNVNSIYSFEVSFVYVYYGVELRIINNILNKYAIEHISTIWAHIVEFK